MSRNSTNNERNCKPSKKKYSKNYSKKSAKYPKPDIGYVDNGYSTSVTPNIVTHNNRKDNDPEWYMNIKELGKDYASLPFNQVLGLPSNTVRSSLYSETPGLKYVPGIMVLEFMPTLGPANSPTSPVNMAAQQLYTLVRQANSGAKNYDKTDLMMLIVAMDSAYMFYETLLRAYRILGTYSGVNRYVPNYLLNALGFDVSLQYDLAAFRGVIDMFAYKLASVNIPDQFDYIKRHSWMCSNIYRDDEDLKSQVYAFKCRGYYIWTEGVGDTVTHLTYTPIGSITSAMTLEQITNFIDKLMNPILGSEDIGVMTGDMQKAFGEGGMIKIKPVEDYAALEAVYSPEVLLQIRNTFCSPAIIAAFDPYTPDITPVLTDLVAGPYLTQTIVCQAETDGFRRTNVKPVLNFIKEETSPENVMVSTRLISLPEVYETEASTSDGYKMTAYGTEIIVNMVMYGYDKDHNPQSYTIDQDIFSTFIGGTGMSEANMHRVVWHSMFNNAPAIYCFGLIGSTKPTPIYLGPITNLCNYCYIDEDELIRLHEVAVMSLFNVKDYKLGF